MKERKEHIYITKDGKVLIRMVHPDHCDLADSLMRNLYDATPYHKWRK